MATQVQAASELIERLSPAELIEFSVWFAEFQDRQWERQIAEDSEAGHLDDLIERTRRDFEAGLYHDMTP